MYCTRCNKYAHDRTICPHCGNALTKQKVEEKPKYYCKKCRRYMKFKICGIHGIEYTIRVKYDADGSDTLPRAGRRDNTSPSREEAVNKISLEENDSLESFADQLDYFLREVPAKKDRAEENQRPEADSGQFDHSLPETPAHKDRPEAHPSHESSSSQFAHSLPETPAHKDRPEEHPSHESSSSQFAHSLPETPAHKDRPEAHLSSESVADKLEQLFQKTSTEKVDRKEERRTPSTLLPEQEQVQQEAVTPAKHQPAAKTSPSTDHSRELVLHPRALARVRPSVMNFGAVAAEKIKEAAASLEAIVENFLNTFRPSFQAEMEQTKRPQSFFEKLTQSLSGNRWAFGHSTYAQADIDKEIFRASKVKPRIIIIATVLLLLLIGLFLLSSGHSGKVSSSKLSTGKALLNEYTEMPGQEATRTITSGTDLQYHYVKRL